MSKRPRSQALEKDVEMKDPWRVTKKWPRLASDAAGNKVWILKVPGVVAEAWKKTGTGGALGEVAERGGGSMLTLAPAVAKATRMKGYRFFAKAENETDAPASSSSSSARFSGGRRSSRERIERGALVEIRGLQTKAALNGCEATVVGPALPSAVSGGKVSGFYQVVVHNSGPGGRSITLDALHVQNMTKLAPKYLYTATTATTISSDEAIAAGARRKVLAVSAELHGRVTHTCRLQPPSSALGGGLKRTKYKKLCRQRIIRDEEERPGVAINKNMRMIRAETQSANYDKLMSTVLPRKSASGGGRSNKGADGRGPKLHTNSSGARSLIDLIYELFKQERFLSVPYLAKERRVPASDVRKAIKRANNRTKGVFVYQTEGEHFKKWECVIGAEARVKDELEDGSGGSGRRY